MVEAVLDLMLEGLHMSHPAAQDALAELVEDLGAKGLPPLVDRATRGEFEGAKGGILELAVSVAAPGSIACLVRVIQIWLGRDRRRTLIVSIRETGHDVSIKIDGSDISDDVLIETVRSVSRIAGRSDGSHADSIASPTADVADPDGDVPDAESSV